MVLGAEVRAGGRPSRTLRVRALHAARLYAKGHVKVVIPTGGVGRHPPSEAEAISAILKNAGVPEESILLEDQARNTLGSARRIAELARSEGIEDVLVVTDPLHCVRAVSAFEAFGLHASAAAAYESPMWTNKGLRRGQLLREAVTICWYRLRYRAGG